MGKRINAFRFLGHLTKVDHFEDPIMDGRIHFMDFYDLDRGRLELV
jgi:hypothetical protein